MSETLARKVIHLYYVIDEMRVGIRLELSKASKSVTSDPSYVSDLIRRERTAVAELDALLGL